MDDRALRAAYAECRTLARSHYENFPVASLLLPARFRNPVAVLYAFARKADDLADEGDATATQRIEALDTMRRALDDIASGHTPKSSLYLALADTIAQHQLPIGLLHDLLSAFRQDVDTREYADFGSLMDYCRRSANPVGRLLLHLWKQDDTRNLGYSDAICSALQLINFLQDIQQDLRENGRIYLPQDEMQRFQVPTEDLRAGRCSAQMQQLLHFQAQRAQRLLLSGAPLATRLPGRLGLELRLIVLGGNRIAQKLLARGADCFARPRLSKSDRLWMLWHALKGGLG